MASNGGNRIRYHRRPPWWLTKAGPPGWTMTIGAPRDLSALRRALTDYLTAHGRADLSGDAGLIMTELSSNALRHGRGDMQAKAWQTRFHLVVAVTDQGNRPARLIRIPRVVGPPDAGGRGLAIVAALARIDVVVSAAGTMVLATLP